MLTTRPMRRSKCRFKVGNSYSYSIRKNLPFCIVLMGWPLLPNALRPFQYLLCLFFQASGFLMSYKSQTRDPQLKVPPRGLVLRIFRPEKVHRPQPGLNPWTLDFEASTVPRDHRGRQILINIYNIQHIWIDVFNINLESNLSYSKESIKLR